MPKISSSSNKYINSVLSLKICYLKNGYYLQRCHFQLQNHPCFYQPYALCNCQRAFLNMHETVIFLFMIQIIYFCQGFDKFCWKGSTGRHKSSSGTNLIWKDAFFLFIVLQSCVCGYSTNLLPFSVTRKLLTKISCTQFFFPFSLSSYPNFLCFKLFETYLCRAYHLKHPLSAR